MYTLAFDTTGQSCSIILLKENKIIDSYVKNMDYGQGEALIPGIKNILDAARLTFKDISLLVVCVGPGSFTGVRSGISAARAFGIAHKDLTLIGVSSFEAYVNDIPSEELSDINAVVIETKREDFYFQAFDKELNKLLPASAMNKEEIIDFLRGKKATITGDGVERFLFTPSGLKFNHIKTPSNLSIEALGLNGIKKLQNKDAQYPKPLYLRAPDVCVKA